MMRRKPLHLGLSAAAAVIAVCVTAGTAFAAVEATPNPVKIPPKVQTPVLAIARLCSVSGGVSAAFSLARTGAAEKVDSQGAVSGFVPATYLLGDAGSHWYSRSDLRATGIGASVQGTATVPGVYKVGQVVRLFALAIDPGVRTYEPNSAPVSATVSLCKGTVPDAPRLGFVAKDLGKHRLQLTVNVTGAIKSSTWWWNQSGKWVRLGSGRTMVYRFAKAGSYALKLIVVLPSGQSASVSRSVRVR
jgi:hypothetical protein